MFGALGATNQSLKVFLGLDHGYTQMQAARIAFLILFGVKVLGRLMGVILAADGVAEAMTPMVVAKIRDATGSYDAGFFLLTGLAFTGLLVISFLPPTLSKTSQRST